MTRCSVAVIGGTGSSELLRGLCREERRIRTESGAVDVALARFGPTSFAFLHRHGPDHTVPPHAIRHDRHMHALKHMGVRRILAINAVGSLRSDLSVGSVVLLSDFIALHPTVEAGVERPARHADLSAPYCPILREQILSAMSHRTDFVSSGVMFGVTGPRYETPSEVRLFGTMGGDVVGMTGVGEAIAAREAGLCYAALACVTNQGVGLSASPVAHGAVTAAMQQILRTLKDDLLEAVRRVAGLDQDQACCWPGY